MFLFPAVLNPAAPAVMHDIRRYALHAPVQWLSPRLSKVGLSETYQEKLPAGNFRHSGLSDLALCGVVKSILAPT